MDIASGRIVCSNELFLIAGRERMELDWPTLRGWIHPDARRAHEDCLSKFRFPDLGGVVAPFSGNGFSTFLQTGGI